MRLWWEYTFAVTQLHLWLDDQENLKKGGTCIRDAKGAPNLGSTRMFQSQKLVRTPQPSLTVVGCLKVTSACDHHPIAADQEFRVKHSDGTLVLILTKHTDDLKMTGHRDQKNVGAKGDLKGIWRTQNA